LAKKLGVQKLPNIEKGLAVIKKGVLTDYRQLWKRISAAAK